MKDTLKSVGEDVVSELTQLNLGDIAMSDIIGYITTFGKNLLIAVVVYFVGRFLIKYAIKALKIMSVKRDMAPSLTTFLHSLVSISLNLLLAITIVGIMGIDTSSFLAVFASAGVAVGMALSGTLQNFAGGVLILILKPYKVGDRIEAQGYAGVVKEILIFHTVLTTPDNQTIIIPNGPLANGSLTNSTAATTRRVDINVEVAYGTKTDDVRKVLNNIIETDERIIKDVADLLPAIPMTTMGTSSIVFQMRVWGKSEDYWNLKFDLTEKIYQELTAAGIEIPFQQMDVHLIK
jgi:small conductance mechanosensitive channel